MTDKYITNKEKELKSKKESFFHLGLRGRQVLNSANDVISFLKDEVGGDQDALVTKHIKALERLKKDLEKKKLQLD